MTRIAITTVIVFLVVAAIVLGVHLASDEEPAVTGGEPGGVTQRQPGAVTPAQQRELDRIATLGYVAGRGAAPHDTGVLVHEADRAQPGPTLFTYAEGPEAVLVGMTGNVIHSWSRPGAKSWARAHLFANGDLLAITSDPYRLMRIDRDSKLLWLLALQAHHDFDVQDDGTIWVLVRVPVKRDEIHGGSWLLDDALVHVSEEGEELGRVSLLEAFERTPAYREWVGEDRLPDGPDIFHTNSVEIVGGSRALVSIRTLGAVAMIDLASGTIEWLRTGEWRMQHEAQLLGDRLLLFDNLGLGEQSRVLEVELPSGDVVWSYTAPGFLTKGAGAQQRLGNGSTLVTESERGRIIEVTRAGKIVWEYVTPRTVADRPETVLGIMRAERLSGDFPLEWADGASQH